jgi:hypothetical protein
MSWWRAHFVDVCPDITSFSRVWVWNFFVLPLWSALSDERVRVTLRLTVSQYIFVSSPLCGRLPRYCFFFKSFGLEFVVLSLWSALSGHYLRNRSTLDLGVLDYIGILYHKEHPPEVWHIPPGTPCIHIQQIGVRIGCYGLGRGTH